MKYTLYYQLSFYKQWVAWIVVFICLLTGITKLPAQVNTSPGTAFHQLDKKPLTTKADLIQYSEAFGALEEPDIETQERFHKRALEAAKKLKLDSLCVLNAYRLATLYYYEMDSFEPAYQLFTEYYPLLKKQEYHIIAGEFANDMANLIREAFGDAEALPYFFESIKFFTKNNKESHCTYPLGNISNLYFEAGDIDKAIQYLKEASRYSVKLDEPKKSYNQAYDYADLADFLSTKGATDSVEHYLAKAFSATNRVKEFSPTFKRFPSLLTEIHYTAATIYVREKKYKLARKHLEQAKEVGDLALIDNTLLQLTNLALMEKNYPEAKKQLDEIASSISSLTEKEMYFTHKRTYHEAVGEYQVALAMSDSLFSYYRTNTEEQKLRSQAIADVKYQTFKKQEQIDDLEKQKQINNLRLQRTRTFSLAGLLSIFILCTLVYLLYRRVRRKQRFNILLEKEVAKKTQNLQLAKVKLEDINEELRQINYVISHDLKEPLRTIVSFSTLALKETGGNIKLQEFLTFIHKAGKHLALLINDVLEFNKIDRNPYESNQVVDANQIVHETTASLDDLITRARATVTIQNTLPTLQTSKTALFIVFKNLIENGMKYNKNINPEVAISYSNADNLHQFFFQDNGMGIDAQFHEQIFQISKRLHNRHDIEGSGLGLAISKKIAKKYHGDLRVHASEPGKGSTFVFILPHAPAIVEVDGQPNPQNSPNPKVVS